MNDFTIRLWREDDRAALLSLWQTGFGDDEDFILTFWDTFLTPDNCVVAECDGRVVSAIYFLEGPVLHPYRRNTLTSAYTYSLSTDPAYRRRGIGGAVYKACCEAIYAQGYDAACILPESAALGSFYQKLTGARQIGAVREAHYTADELKAVSPSRCIRIGAEEYAAMREGFLSSEAHAEMSVDYCLWEQELTDRFGGGLFMLMGGVAAAELDGERCIIRELILPGGGEKEATAAVAAFCRAKEYTVCAPAWWDGPGELKPHMLASFREEPKFFVPDDIWWGFGFE